jgi:hypothetical protein
MAAAKTPDDKRLTEWDKQSVQELKDILEAYEAEHGGVPYDKIPKSRVPENIDPTNVIAVDIHGYALVRKPRGGYYITEVSQLPLASDTPRTLRRRGVLRYPVRMTVPLSPRQMQMANSTARD